MDFIENTFGPSGALAFKFVVALVVVLLLIAVLTWVMRQISIGRLGHGGRNRQPRLQIMDATMIDNRRKLVLVRRDDIEHLILIGGGNDVVVEQTIVKGMPASYAQRRPAPNMRQRPPAEQEKKRGVESQTPPPVAATTAAAATVTASIPSNAESKQSAVEEGSQPQAPKNAPFSPTTSPTASLAPEANSSTKDILDTFAQRFDQALSKGENIDPNQSMRASSPTTEKQYSTQMPSSLPMERQTSNIAEKRPFTSSGSRQANLNDPMIRTDHSMASSSYSETTHTAQDQEKGRQKNRGANYQNEKQLNSQFDADKALASSQKETENTQAQPSSPFPTRQTTVSSTSAALINTKEQSASSKPMTQYQTVASPKIEPGIPEEHSSALKASMPPKGTSITPETSSTIAQSKKENLDNSLEDEMAKLLGEIAGEHNSNKK